MFSVGLSRNEQTCIKYRKYITLENILPPKDMLKMNFSFDGTHRNNLW